jgi:hypothetical protein
MGGLRSYLTAINSTVDANSFSAAPLDYVNDILQQCWSAGARDLDTVVVGPQWKRELSTTNASKLFIAQTEQGVTRKISQLTTDFGDVEVVLSPYLADRHLMAVSRQRIIPINLRGRAFQREDLAKTGDASKAHVIGEYTAEFHGPEKMGQLRVG